MSYILHFDKATSAILLFLIWWPCMYVFKNCMCYIRAKDGGTSESTSVIRKTGM